MSNGGVGGICMRLEKSSRKNFGGTHSRHRKGGLDNYNRSSASKEPHTIVLLNHLQTSIFEIKMGKH